MARIFSIYNCKQSMKCIWKGEALGFGQHQWTESFNRLNQIHNLQHYKITKVLNIVHQSTVSGIDQAAAANNICSSPVLYITHMMLHWKNIYSPMFKALQICHFNTTPLCTNFIGSTSVTQQYLYPSSLAGL